MEWGIIMGNQYKKKYRASYQNAREATKYLRLHFIPNG